MSCNDTDDLLSPDDVVMTAQNRADIEHYQTMANSVLKDVASHVSTAKGGYCVIRLVLNSSGGAPVAIDASHDGNSVLLCDETLKLLDAVTWPKSLSDTTTVFDINVHG